MLWTPSNAQQPLSALRSVSNSLQMLLGFGTAVHYFLTPANLTRTSGDHWPNKDFES